MGLLLLLLLYDRTSIASGGDWNGEGGFAPPPSEMFSPMKDHSKGVYRVCMHECRGSYYHTKEPQILGRGSCDVTAKCSGCGLACCYNSFPHIDTDEFASKETFLTGLSQDECEDYVQRASAIDADRREAILENRIRRILTSAYQLCSSRRPEECSAEAVGDIIPKIYSGLAAIWSRTVNERQTGAVDFYSLDAFDIRREWLKVFETDTCRPLTDRREKKYCKESVLIMRPLIAWVAENSRNERWNSQDFDSLDHAVDSFMDHLLNTKRARSLIDLTGHLNVT